MGVYVKISLTLTYIGLTAAREVYFITSFLQVNYSVDMLLFYLKSHLTERVKRGKELGIS